METPLKDKKAERVLELIYKERMRVLDALRGAGYAAASHNSAYVRMATLRKDPEFARREEWYSLTYPKNEVALTSSSQELTALKNMKDSLSAIKAAGIAVEREDVANLYMLVLTKLLGGPKKPLTAQEANAARQIIRDLGDIHGLFIERSQSMVLKAGDLEALEEQLKIIDASQSAQQQPNQTENRQQKRLTVSLL